MMDDRLWAEINFPCGCGAKAGEPCRTMNRHRPWQQVVVYPLSYMHVARVRAADKAYFEWMELGGGAYGGDLPSVPT